MINEEKKEIRGQILRIEHYVETISNAFFDFQDEIEALLDDIKDKQEDFDSEIYRLTQLLQTLEESQGLINNYINWFNRLKV